MEKFYKKLFRFDGFIIHILIFLLIFFGMEVFQGIPTPLLSETESVDKDNPLHYSSEGSSLFGGSRPNLLGGQKMTVKLSSSNILNVTIYQESPVLRGDEVIYIDENNIQDLDEVINVKSTGDLQVIISTTLDEIIDIEISITRKGYSTPILLYFISLVLFICILVLFRFKKNNEFQDIKTAVKLLKPLKINTRIQRISIYCESFGPSHVSLILILPTILIAIDPQITPFTTNDYFSIDENINFRDNNSEFLTQIKLFSGFLMNSCLKVFLYAFPISLSVLIIAGYKGETKNEYVYPINKSDFMIARIVFFNFYLVIIPLLDLFARIFISNYYGTLKINYLSVLCSIFFVEAFIIFILSFYFLIFDIFKSPFLQFGSPIVLFLFFVGFGDKPFYQKNFVTLFLRFETFTKFISSSLFLIFSTIFFVGLRIYLSENKINKIDNWTQEYLRKRSKD